MNSNIFPDPFPEKEIKNLCEKYNIKFEKPTYHGKIPDLNESKYPIGKCPIILSLYTNIRFYLEEMSPIIYLNNETNKPLLEYAECNKRGNEILEGEGQIISSRIDRLNKLRSTNMIQSINISATAAIEECEKNENLNTKKIEDLKICVELSYESWFKMNKGYENIRTIPERIDFIKNEIDTRLIKILEILSK